MFRYSPRWSCAISPSSARNHRPWGIPVATCFVMSLHLHLYTCTRLECDPQSEFVCFVDYTAMSAHSVLNVRDKSRDIQAQRRCQSAHTSTKIIAARVMSTVDSYPGTRSLRRPFYLAFPFPSPHASIYTPLIRLLPQLPSTTPFHTPQSPQTHRSYSAPTLLGDPLLKDVW